MLGCILAVVDKIIVGRQMENEPVADKIGNRAERDVDERTEAEQADAEPEIAEAVLLADEGAGNEDEGFQDAAGDGSANDAVAVSVAIVVEAADGLGRAGELEGVTAGEAAKDEGKTIGHTSTRSAETNEPADWGADDGDNPSDDAEAVCEGAAVAVQHEETDEVDERGEDKGRSSQNDPEEVDAAGEGGVQDDESAENGSEDAPPEGGKLNAVQVDE